MTLAVGLALGPWLAGCGGSERSKSAEQSETSKESVPAGRTDLVPSVDSVERLAGDAPPSTEQYGPPQVGKPSGFATDLLVGDVDGDSWPDVVVSNGNDMKAESIDVFLNDRKGGLFLDEEGSPREPDHRTHPDDAEFYTAMSWGDLLGTAGVPDRRADFAVSLPFGHPEGDSPGVLLFRGEEPSRSFPFLVPKKPHGSPERPIAASFANAIGDLNADGLEDLLVATGTLSDDPCKPCIKPGTLRVYLNHPKTGLSPKPSWESPESMVVAELLITDMDRDGWVDLVVGARRPRIYYGHEPRGSESELQLELGWTGPKAYEASFGYGIDAAVLTDEGGQHLLVSSMCEILPDCPTMGRGESCFPGIKVYHPVRGEHDGQRSVSSLETTLGPYPIARFASKARFVDTDADGNLDIVAGYWFGSDDSLRLPMLVRDEPSDKQDCTLPDPTKLVGAPLRLYRGAHARDPFERSPELFSGVSIAQGIVVSDLRRRAVKTYCAQIPAADLTRGVVTLPSRNPEGVVDVWLGRTKLLPEDYVWTRDTNFVSVGRCGTSSCARIPSKQEITVRYRHSAIKDLLVANWSPVGGNNIYYSKLPETSRCPSCKLCPEWMPTME